MLVARNSVVLLAMTAIFAANVTAEEDDANDLDAKAKQFVQFLADGKFKEATADFDATMSKVMSPFALNLTWKSQQLLAGAFEEQVSTRRDKAGKYDIVLVTSKFRRKSLDIKVVFDQQQKIAGLFFLPTYAAPSYADTSKFTERDVVVGTEPWQLPGTLSLPSRDGPFPAVVLVHGSGPNDRDETVGANKPFKDLAWGLATQGVAVLRYDKRTKVHGAKMETMKTLTVKEETIDDALSAAKLLADEPGIDKGRIVIVGHSLGGYVMPRMALADKDGVVASFVSLAGSTRPLEDMMWEQLNYIFMLDGSIAKEEQEHLDKVKKGIDRVKSDEFGKSDKSPALGAEPAYWLDLRDYKPHELAKTVKHPMLILQGQRDYQVTMMDFENWRGALDSRDDVTLKTYPTLNHLFIAGTGPSKPAEYQKAGNVAEKVIKDIAEWVRR